MALLIKNGEIITATDRYVADIWCENETITRIDRNLPAPPGAEVIDAKGKYVFPGFIDPHVHIYLPFMGTFAKDTHDTAGRAALVGGTTTFIEMICPGRTEEPLAAFELWLGKAQGHCACDFTFHMGASRYDEGRRSSSPRSSNAASAASKSSSPTKAPWASPTRSSTGRSAWPRSSASSPPRTARMRTWSWHSSRCCWPKARPARNGITRAARRWSRPKASTTS